MEESENLYKLYGYGLYKGEFPTPKIAVNKVQETLHFRYLKLLVKVGLFPSRLSRFTNSMHHPGGVKTSSTVALPYVLKVQGVNLKSTVYD